MPNLYAADEIEKIVNLVRPLAKAAGKLETRDAILQHYVQLGAFSVHRPEALLPSGISCQRIRALVAKFDITTLNNR